MQRLWFYLVIVLSASLAHAICSIKAPDEIINSLGAIDKTIRDEMAAHDISAASVAISREGTWLFRQAYGEADSMESLFQAGSISKPVTAFAVLKWDEAGRLQLNDPLSNYVLTPYLPEQPWVSLVTTRTILNHSSGLKNDVTGKDRHIYFRPGSQYSYSGGSYLYLQQALEDLSGTGFAQMMRPELDKLRMRNSTFVLAYEQETYVSSAFSLVTNPTELTYFFHEIIRPASANAKVAEKMRTPTLDIPDGRKMGLGISSTQCENDTLYTHSGMNFSLHYSFALAAEFSGLTFVAMARGPQSEGFPQRLAQIATGYE